MSSVDHQPMQGSTADYCSRWPGEPHTMSIRMQANALVSVRRCTSCGWIDFDDLREQAEALIADGRRQATEGAYARGVNRGFGEAVAALLDDARYEHWWSALPQDHPDYGYWSQYPRRQFADYLEAVGPWEPAPGGSDA